MASPEVAMVASPEAAEVASPVEAEVALRDRLKWLVVEEEAAAKDLNEVVSSEVLVVEVTWDQAVVTETHD